MSINNSKSTHLLNELAKERNRAAAERTLLAWIRRCLSLITFGVALEQIYVALDRAIPNVTAEIGTQLVISVSLVFIVLGICLLLLTIIQHHLTLKAIEMDSYLNSSFQHLNLFIIVSISMFGILSFIAVLIKAT